MSARSVLIHLTNQSEAKLTRDKFGLNHGGWVGSQVPAESIEDRNEVLFKSHETGVATGVEGHVEYHIGEQSSGESDKNLLIIRWHNPFLGSNSYSVEYPEG